MRRGVRIAQRSRELGALPKVLSITLIIEIPIDQRRLPPRRTSNRPLAASLSPRRRVPASGVAVVVGLPRVRSVGRGLPPGGGGGRPPQPLAGSVHLVG